MENKTYYISTPIYYASGNLHLGHCCTSIFADAIARYKRLKGFDVMFLTGADEHGQKVEENAKKMGLKPKQFVDELDKKYKELWKLLDISYTKYIRTTDDYHEKAVQNIFAKLYKNNDIYKSSYKGLYCVACEAFFTESQLKDGMCPDCGRPVKMMEEEAYFFKLSKYQKALEQYYETHPDFIRLESTKKEMINSFFKQGLQDLCVTRTSFDWGVKVPFDDKHVIYVWIDALTNYITALGYLQDNDLNFKKFWPCDLHLMAKEIVRFHVIIWPAILMSLGLPLPKQIHAHGWLTKAGTKMGKSLGNGFNPFVLCNRYGVDAVRYFLLHDGPIMGDTPYDNESFLNRYNSDLCNELGNLVSRTVAMIEQFGGTLTDSNLIEVPEDESLINTVLLMPSAVEKYMESLDLNLALNEIWKVLRRSNKYIDETTPWKLKENRKRLNLILRNLSFALFSVATMLQAFIPSTAENIFNCMNLNHELAKLENINKTFAKNFQLINIKKQNNLFNRLDINSELKFLLNEKESKMQENKSEIKIEDVKQENIKPEIVYDDFDKLDLRVGKIISSEKVENADKLLKFTVSVGNEIRTIVSGVATHYKPEELLNKNVVIVANLKPRKIRGIESYGMILYAEDENDNICFVMPSKDMPSGSQVC